MSETEPQGGRVFFSNVRRSLEEEDEIIWSSRACFWSGSTIATW